MGGGFFKSREKLNSGDLSLRILASTSDAETQAAALVMIV